MVAVYIVLFILFLSVLIVVHEAGHFTAAKIFKVYCQEFSLGFGPALIHTKKKDAETYFSLRCIPFGGYVAMYGEEETKPEGVEIDPSRSLENIKKWKKAIILVAGVTMNVILAIIMFFISEQACPQYQITLNYATYADNSPVLEVINNTEGMSKDRAIYMRGVADKNNASTLYAWLDGAHKKEDTTTPEAIVTNNDGSTFDVTVCINQSKFTINDTSYNNALVVFKNYDFVRKNSETGKEETWRYPDISSKVSLESVKSLKFHITNCNYKVTEDGKLQALEDEHKITSKDAIELMQEPGKVKDLGVSMYKEEYWNNYQGVTDKNGIYDDRNAFRKCFVDFGNSATVIFKGLGSLFTPDGWKNVGGIVAIGVTTSQTLQNFGIGKFLFYWGMISVNLAIVNLFPFPGLDGWQLLVTGIEGVTRKKVPLKVKAIVSAIGIGLLFILMILIIIKDIMFYV